MKNSLQDGIVRLLPSEELRAAISERQTVFSDVELLKIVYDFSPDYETRVQYLENLKESFSGETRDYAAALIKDEKGKLESFRASDGSAVYELHVKEKPDSYDERYLCADLETALKTIPRYYEEYACVGAKETEETVYRIVKRAILSGREENFDEDYLGDAYYVPGPALYSVDTKEKETWCGEQSCPDCTKVCLTNTDVPYPRILSAGDVVKYGGTPEMPERLGFIPGLNEDGSEQIAEYYVIPLDCEDVRLHRFSSDCWGYCDHDHILPPLIRKIPIESLDERTRGDLEAFIAYLKTQN